VSLWSSHGSPDFAGAMHFVSVQLRPVSQSSLHVSPAFFGAVQ
jgi:hypothetical protein